MFCRDIFIEKIVEDNLDYIAPCGFRSNASFSLLCDQWKQTGGLKSTEIADWWGKPTEDQDRLMLIRYLTVTQNTPIQETFVWLINKESKAELVSYQAQPGSVAAKSPSPSP
jgi:hypothetical protein